MKFFMLRRIGLLAAVFCLLAGVLSGCMIVVQKPTPAESTTAAVTTVTTPVAAVTTTEAPLVLPSAPLEIVYDHYLLGSHSLSVLGEDLYDLYCGLVTAVLNYETRIEIPAHLRRDKNLRFVTNFFQRHNLLEFFTGTIFNSVDGKYLEWDFWISKEAFDDGVSFIEVVVPEIIRDNLREEYNQADAAIAIYSYLAQNIEYNLEAESTNAYGVLINRQGICVGFTYALQLLLRQAGYDDGVASEWLTGSWDEPGHIWNTLYLNGSYYHVDATWENGDWQTGGYALKYFGMDDNLRSSIGTPTWDLDLHEPGYDPPVCDNGNLAILYNSVFQVLDLDQHQVYFLTEEDWFLLHTEDFSITVPEKGPFED